MSNFLRLFAFYSLIAIVINYLSIAQEKASGDASIDYDEALNYLVNLKPSGEGVAVTSEIIFKKDVGLFKLQDGTLYTCSGYKEFPYALIFIGKGEFSFTPPSEIEKKQLFRFYDTENFQTDFNELFLFFDDDTYERLIDTLTLKKVESKSIQQNIKNYLSNFKTTKDESLAAFLRSMMNQGRNGFFYSQIQENKFEPVYFQINPYEFEEVSFMRGVYIATKNYREVINLFPAKKETLNIYSSKKPNKYFLDLISYDIKSTIADNLDFSARCTIDFKSIESDEQWTMFYLYEELHVDSVTWENGNLAEFFNPKESGELWIKCTIDYLDANQHSIVIYYHGDLLEKNELGWIELNSSIFWYPRFDYREKTTFLLTFHTPAKYELISIGDLENREAQGDVVTTSWRCSTPSRNVSFNIGNFEMEEVENEDVPKVNVYTSEYGHQLISSYLRKYGIYSMSDASEYIAQDISNSLVLYSSLFGNLSLNSIRVTEIPYLHGEAFPGLIHLSWSTVIQTSFEGEDQIFRAHEAAHQWWGIGVDFDTYHDQWLSEGFAQYSGLWYLQAAIKDNELFFDILNEWKDEIIDVRKYIFSSGQEAGPVWLGYRTNTSNTRGDYNLIVYKKGAWILHMLRSMLLDLNTMNEDKMKSLMQDYYDTYKNKSASTEEFKRIVDKHFGEDMSWFFDQYIYGTDIPLYRVAYKTEKTNEGKTIITLRVLQEEVSESFKMYVPIKLVLDGDRIGRIRIEVKGEETIYSTPPIAGDLEELIFNDLESILCEVEYEDWD